MIARWRALPPRGRTATAAAGVALFMAGLGWASVPLYDLFCRVTGYGGTTQRAEAAGETVLDRTIRIRFDASKARDFPWEFRPVERTMEVRIGENALAFYEAHNPTDEPVAGVASFNVTPFAAGVHFVKIHCFCFEYQVLQPGETVQMPVSFYVDPALVSDRDARDTHTITLSYTFHRTEPVEEHAAVAAPGAPAATQN